MLPSACSAASVSSCSAVPLPPATPFHAPSRSPSDDDDDRGVLVAPVDPASCVASGQGTVVAFPPRHAEKGVRTLVVLLENGEGIELMVG